MNNECSVCLRCLETKLLGTEPDGAEDKRILFSREKVYRTKDEIINKTSITSEGLNQGLMPRAGHQDELKGDDKKYHIMRIYPKDICLFIYWEIISLFKMFF